MRSQSRAQEEQAAKAASQSFAGHYSASLASGDTNGAGQQAVHGLDLAGLVPVDIAEAEPQPPAAIHDFAGLAQIELAISDRLSNPNPDASKGENRGPLRAAPT